jgi:hypothetical protein
LRPEFRFFRARKNRQSGRAKIAAPCGAGASACPKEMVAVRQARHLPDVYVETRSMYSPVRVSILITLPI